MNSRLGGKSFEENRHKAGGYGAQDTSRQELTSSTNQTVNTAGSRGQQQRPGGNVHSGGEMSQGNIAAGSHNTGGGREPEGSRDLAIREKQQSRPSGGGGGKPSSQRICMKCNQPLTGQFVRAIGGTFHLECFKCQVPTLIVISSRHILTLDLRTAGR